MYMNAPATRLNERPIRGFTYDSGMASNTSTSALIGTEMRQKSSARSVAPSPTSKASNGSALTDKGGARTSAGSIRRPSR